MGTIIVEDVGSIDNSPPERVPHEEYVGKDLAKARLLMPLKLTRLEQRVEDIEKKLSILVDNTNELVFLLKGAYVPDHTHKLLTKPIEYQNYIS